jgi:hypothetical protein
MKRIIFKDISNSTISNNFQKSYNLNEQVNFINMLYLGNQFNEKKEIIKLLKKKINGYKSQDIKKKRYNILLFISFDELIEKLVISKLVCHYCRCNCCLISKEKRENIQWTLDRINNDIGHYNDNVVISCLKCNLQKRRRNEKHFKFAKQMKIIKHF